MAILKVAPGEKISAFFSGKISKFAYIWIRECELRGWMDYDTGFLLPVWVQKCADRAGSRSQRVDTLFSRVLSGLLSCLTDCLCPFVLGLTA